VLQINGTNRAALKVANDRKGPFPAGRPTLDEWLHIADSSHSECAGIVMKTVEA
jgi:hypothetical protein